MGRDTQEWRKRNFESVNYRLCEFREALALFISPPVPTALFPAYRQLAITVRDESPQLPVCLGPGKLQTGCGVTSDRLVHDQEIKDSSFWF